MVDPCLFIKSVYEWPDSILLQVTFALVSIYTGVRQASARDERRHGLLHNTALLYAHASLFFYSCL